MEQMKVLVVGLGLIGGSMCKAMRRFTNHLVYGYDTDRAVLEQAVRDGAILEAVPKSGFHEFDLIMVCLHPRAAKAFLMHTSRISGRVPFSQTYAASRGLW